MRQSLLTVALLALMCLVWMMRDLVVLVGFAAVFAYAIDPVVSWLERRSGPRGRTMPRWFAAGLVIVLIGMIVGALLAEAVPRLLHQFVRFASAAPGALARLEQEGRAFLEGHGMGGVLGAGAPDAGASATSVLDGIQGWLMSRLGQVLGKLGGLVSLVLIPLFAFYMLADRQLAHTSLLAMAPRNRRPQAERFLNALDRALRAYVRGQALVCLAMGVAMAIVLRVLGFPVALLLGVVVGLGEVIPFLGFWIAAAAIALEGYSNSPGLAIAGVAAYGVVNSLMGTFVSPRLLGKQVKLHPFLINVAVIGGGMLLGPAGAILALPAAAIGKALFDEFGPKHDGPGAPASGVTAT